MRARQHCSETERLAALRRYDILDTPDEQAYDDITRIAAQICQAPVAVINFIDAGRQWFKSAVGIGVRQTPLDNSICAHAILENNILVVPDTSQDCRFADNPVVTGNPHFRFYAGALLQSPHGYPLGTLCVLDYKTRELSRDQEEALLALSRQVMANLELRVRTNEVAALNERLHQAVYESSHRLKNHLQILAATVDMATMGSRGLIPAQEVERLGTQIRALSVIHDILTADTKVRIDSSTVSSSELLDGLLTILQETADSHDLKFEIADIPLPLPMVTSLALGVNELVSNAIKHGNSLVRVSLAVDCGHCLLEVSDDGDGFPADFDPQASGRTGMELIELTRKDLNGRLSYRSGENGGCVTLRFPTPAV